MSQHRRSSATHRVLRDSAAGYQRTGAALLGSAVLAVGLVPLTAGAAFAATPTASQCKAYNDANEAAKTTKVVLAEKEALESQARAHLAKVKADPDSTAADIAVAQSALAKAVTAVSDAYGNDANARSTLETALKAIDGDRASCANVKEPTEPKPTEPKPAEPKPTAPKPTSPKPTGEGSNGWGSGEDDGGDKVLGARTEPSSSSESSGGTVGPISVYTGDSGTQVLGASDSTQVSEVPEGSVDAGDGSTEDGHIGQALLGLGSLGLAGTAGFLSFRRRQSA